jgi:hypothetical protein
MMSTGGWPAKIGIGFLIFVACGIYDVLRNRKIDGALVKRYFTGNGLATWFFAPWNTFMDIITLPFINKGVYKFEDMPAEYQAEIKKLIDTAYKENLVARLEEKAKENPRTMIFFKWYGNNIKTSVDIPAYHEKYKYIKTIGVSVFNKKQSTSKHFGPMRVTLRVLYNLNDMTDKTAYLEVGDVTHYWQDEKLFIFDDTLQHQSFNESEKVRYCLFVDILRPSLFPGLLSLFVSGVRFCMQSINAIFYKNWKVIKD